MQRKPIIAITGSAGKTTTREMIAAILQTRWNIFKTTKNGNDAWYTQQYVKEITANHKAVVLEYGLRFKEDLTNCCRLIQPNIGVITNVGTAHIGNFEGEISKLIEAKSELIKGMSKDGLLFLNGDDNNSKLLNHHEFNGSVFTVGLSDHCNYQAIGPIYNAQGIFFEVVLQQQIVPFHLKILGKHNIYNALLSIAVCDQLGFTGLEIAQALSHLSKPPRRLALYKHPKNITIIDDTFNASPESMCAALDVLTEIGQGTKIAILGSMLDQDNFLDGYQRVGKYLAAKNIDYLFTVNCELVGEVTKEIGAAAVACGFPRTRVIHCPSFIHLFHLLLLRPEDTVTFLVKGTLFLDIVNFLKLMAQKPKNSPILLAIAQSLSKGSTTI